MRNSKARVHMCKISQLITDHSDSWRNSFYQLVYHIKLPLAPSLHRLATRPSHPATLPRSAEGNDTATPQDLWEIHSRLPPCLQNTSTPTKELFPSLSDNRKGAHLLDVTQGMSSTACLLWQVLIERQTQPRSVRKPKWIPLDRTRKTNSKDDVLQYKYNESVTKTSQLWYKKNTNFQISLVSVRSRMRIRVSLYYHRTETQPNLCQYNPYKNQNKTKKHKQTRSNNNNNWKQEIFLLEKRPKGKLYFQNKPKKHSLSFWLSKWTK